MSCPHRMFSPATLHTFNLSHTPHFPAICALFRLILTTQKSPHVHLFSLRQRYGLSIDTSLGNLIGQFHKGSCFMIHHVTSFFSICQQFFSEEKSRAGWILPLDFCRYEAPDFARVSLCVVLVQVPDYIPQSHTLATERRQLRISSHSSPTG